MDSLRYFSVKWLTLAAIFVVMFFYNPMARTASNYNKETGISATAVYVSYRVINRVVSTVADTNVSAGVGVSFDFSPGMVLKSLLDTLDRFADILYALILVSAILSTVTVPFASLGSAVAVIGVLFSLPIAFSGQLPSSVKAGLIRARRLCISVGLIVSLGIPTLYTVGAFVGDRITQDAWTSAASSFNQVANSTELSGTESGSAAAVFEPDASLDSDKSWADWAWDGVTSAGSSVGRYAKAGLNYASLPPKILANVPEIIQSSFTILVALIVKVIVIPLLLIGAGIWFFKQFSTKDVIYSELLSEIRLLNTSNQRHESTQQKTAAVGIDARPKGPTTLEGD